MKHPSIEMIDKSLNLGRFYRKGLSVIDTREDPESPCLTFKIGTMRIEDYDKIVKYMNKLEEKRQK